MEIQPYIIYKGFAEVMALGLVPRSLLITRVSAWT